MARDIGHFGVDLSSKVVVVGGTTFASFAWEVGSDKFAVFLGWLMRGFSRIFEDF